MTIWLLALILLASLAGLGYRQGAIRVGVSFVGIMLGALLALPLSRPVRPILGFFGVQDPLLLWVLPPVIVFIVISLLAKTGAAVLHQKVDVYYKYRAGDLRLALWERLNHRTGLCLGILNGAAYIILISFLIYGFSYATYQVASKDQDPKALRLLNRMGKDLQGTGFNRVARSLDELPQSFYQAADVAGLLYHNSLLEARMASYPPFLALAEQPEFQTLAGDRTFLDMRQRGEPVGKLVSESALQPILGNHESVKKLWEVVKPDLSDLRIYLETGRTPKYEPETILGRWEFNVNYAMANVRKARPNIPSREMQKIKQFLVTAFEKTRFVGMTANAAIMKDVPLVKAPAGGPVAPATPQTLRGEWTNLGPNRYVLSFPDVGLKDVSANIEGDRLTVKGGGLDLVFTRQG